MNCIVHVFMYAYYFVVNMRPQYKDKVWWKKYVTQIQMVTISSNFPLCILEILSQDLQSNFYIHDYERMSKDRKLYL